MSREVTLPEVYTALQILNAKAQELEETIAQIYNEDSSLYRSLSTELGETYLKINKLSQVQDGLLDEVCDLVGV